MKIGDKVRFLHGKEEGIIRRIINNRTVDVEIDDGFLIPVLLSELVQISEDEANSFYRPTVEKHEPSAPTLKIIDQEGLFLAIEPQHATITIWLVNNSSSDILFTVHQKKAEILKGISRGIISEYNYTKIEDWDLKLQDQWPALFITLLPFAENTEEIPKVITRKTDISSKVLLKKPVLIDTLGRTAILIDLVEKSKENIDINKIKEAFFSHEGDHTVKDTTSSKKSATIDLHIESIKENQSGINQKEILEIQLEEFERQLDRAVIDGLDSIIFIHGIGNGTLRQTIHKKLGQYPHLKYFEDAQKEKFGFGATKVYLK